MVERGVVVSLLAIHIRSCCCPTTGESEANVRKLFEDAEADQKANGDASELHVIIFDEIDAICKQRGSVSSGSGAVLMRLRNENQRRVAWGLAVEPRLKSYPMFGSIIGSSFSA
jgi:hypothetical protein